jgi:hypothetical protein
MEFDSCQDYQRERREQRREARQPGWMHKADFTRKSGGHEWAGSRQPLVQ